MADQIRTDMKLNLRRIDQGEQKFTTLGYWAWSQPKNRGTLTIEVSRMGDWRHELAVWGHELIEAFYCKLMGITTEACDEFDESFEQKYASGEVSPLVEAGDQRECPYFVGHRMGVAWEHIIILVTFSGWRSYLLACERQMGLRT